MQNSDKAVKEKYKKDFANVRLLINDFDPCGLIESGAPIDEYDSLNHHVLSMVYNSKAKWEIREKILYEIKHYYGCGDVEEIKEPFLTSLEKFLDSVINIMPSR